MRPSLSRGLVGALVIAGWSPAVAACDRNDAEPRASAVQVYVTQRLMPQGMIVAAAKEDGTLKLETLPSDVAGRDAVSDVSGFPCEVAAVELPRGTVIRRSQIVPPAKLGLDHGITPATALPPGC